MEFLNDLGSWSGPKMIQRERLFHRIFTQQRYNKMNRPSSTDDDITHVTTELKLLQIDIVIFILINF
jgi:hypothetical protein